MRPPKSIAVQLGTIAVLLFSMGAFAAFEGLNQPGTNSYEVLVGDSRYEFAWIGVYIVFAFAFIPCRRTLLQAALAHKWLLALVGWTLLSTLWSMDPFLTLRRASALACTTALGLYLGLRFTQRQLLHLLAVALALATVVSAIVAVGLPSVGVMQDLYGGAWRGSFAHKNTLAMAAVLSLITFGSIYVAERNRRMLCLLAMAAVVPELFLSKSASALVDVIIVAAIALMLWMLRSLSRSLLVPVAYWAGGFAVLLVGWLIANSTRVFALLGRDPTLSGRTDLWAFAADAVRQRPWLGYGYSAFWVGPGGDAIRAAVGWDAPHSHNGLLDLSLDIGLLGVVLFLICLLLCFRCALLHALRSSDPYRLWPMMYLTVFTVHNLTETTTMTRNSLYWILFVAVNALLWREDEVALVSEARIPAPSAASLAVPSAL
ncbi:MAG: O-antigen ligase [Acidobacteriaceae bacterium]